ncbi:hypothetical protein [Micromonospora cremea]|uniref:Uncharacterized protein n=1 Tax=Micromonospora cremea TaxID=709881 RepID=A0A1N5ZJ60_9ACTN|nr:hypothetical protein [Micromonospora cremea]SIN21785.1 hypothetical protein SAMN04489832_4062 [Micromonospora cremea]
MSPDTAQRAGRRPNFSGGLSRENGGLSRENGAVGTKVRGRFHLAAQCAGYRVGSSQLDVTVARVGRGIPDHRQCHSARAVAALYVGERISRALQRLGDELLVDRSVDHGMRSVQIPQPVERMGRNDHLVLVGRLSLNGNLRNVS